MNKQDKKFDAILAKNKIARDIAEHKRCGAPISYTCIIAQLKAIEDYIGHDNQPTAEDIFENNSNVIRQFVI